MSEIAVFSGPAQTLADMTRTAAKHRFSLGEWAEGRRADMLPAEVSGRISAELSAVIEAKCPPQAAAKRVARLLACYPPRASDNSADLQAYATVMIEEVRRFPDAILGDVLPEFSRTHPFRPSVAEIVMACEAELSRLSRLRHGISRMERRRAELDKERAEAEQRRAKSEAWMADCDAVAVKNFGAHGVCPGDYAGANRTFQMIESRGSLMVSPWRRWIGLLPSSGDWAPWVAVPMRRAGIFGRAELAVRRGQGNFDDLAEIHDLVLTGDEGAARQLLTEIEARPVTVEGVDVDRPWPLPQGVAELACSFQDMLEAPKDDRGEAA